MAAVPVAMVKFLAPPESLFTVLENVTLSPVVVKVLAALFTVTAPEYVCVPVVETSAPSVVVPDTLNILTPEIAPLITALPVSVKENVAPVIVEEFVIVVPVNVLSAPLNVTAPE